MSESNYLPAETTVMILAAGHGKRMLPLTAHTPKPLLKVGPLSLIEHHLIKLQRSGFRRVVINVAYLGQQIVDLLGGGSEYGLDIQYSDETTTGALETAGGIVHALPMIESDPFLVVNGDIFTDFDFPALLKPLHTLGRIVLVPNPSHNEQGDFDFDIESGKVSVRPENGHADATFSGIALYRKRLFSGLEPGPNALAPILFEAANCGQLEGQHHQGEWHDVGTPSRLADLDRRFTSRN